MFFVVCFLFVCLFYFILFYFFAWYSVLVDYFQTVQMFLSFISLMKFFPSNQFV